MKIGLVTATYAPSRNGVATSTALFAQGLRALGHTVDVYAPAHPAQSQAVQPQATHSPTEQGVYRLPSSLRGAPADYPIMLWPSRPVVAGLPLKGTDIFHTMHPFLAGTLARLWSRRFDTPLVFTAHTQYDQYLHYSPMPRRVSFSLIRSHVAAFARSVDRVLVPGQAMAQMLERYGYEGGVTSMPNPVDLRSFAPISATHRQSVRQRYGLDSSPLVISLGRLAPEKNLETLLSAFDEARKRRPELQLLVVGDGPVRSALEAQKPERTTFAGAVPYGEVPALLQSSDAFMTASESEVLPMSMIEALAASTPLVAAHSPAAQDLIDAHNGLISAPTPEALAQALLEVLDPATLPQRQQAARHSAQQYDLRVRATDLAKVYEELLTARG